MQLSIFSAHQLSGNASDGEDDEDDEEVDELVDGVDRVDVNDGDEHHSDAGADAGAGTDEEDEEEEEDDAENDQVADAFSAQSELIKRRVQQSAQSRIKAAKRKTRNNAKLSVKGKLYHKDHF